MLDTKFLNVGRQSSAAPDTTSIFYNKRFSLATRKRQHGPDPELHHCITKLDRFHLFFFGEAGLDYNMKHVLETVAEALKPVLHSFICDHLLFLYFSEVHC